MISGMDIRRSLVLGFCAAALAFVCLGAPPARPRILGVAHAAFYVSDLAKARAFYKDFLGFDEPFSLKRPDGSDRIVFIKINEDQYLELFAEDPPSGGGRLSHISLYTDNASAMRDYLAARGVKAPETVGKGRIGNSNFNVTDPDGHTVEIVQYEPDGWTRRETGKFVPSTRISARMMHAGFTVGDLGPAMDFYGGILGFRETWRGSSNGSELSWVNMRVPDGEDYLEFMLYGAPPPAERLGVMNHISLRVPDIEKAVKILESRPVRKDYTRAIEIRTGVNRKRQCNLYDPDGTRVELMEPDTVDGKPASPSTAPPPVKTQR
jgi:lactoylglutathione lyase